MRWCVQDVVVMDISMPDQSGVDALKAIKSRFPDLPVLMLSGFPEAHYATNLLRQGASGYLNKECDPGEIVDAVRTVSLGRKYISQAVAMLLAVGHLAESLSLSVKTVSTYRTRVLEKLKLSSNSDLTYYAMTNGLIQ